MLVGEFISDVIDYAGPVTLTVKYAMNLVIKEYVGEKCRALDITQQLGGIVILEDRTEYRLLSGSGQPEVVNSRSMQSFLTIIHALLSICLFSDLGYSMP